MRGEGRPLAAGSTGGFLRRRTWRATNRRALWRRGVQRRFAAAVVLGAAAWLAVLTFAPAGPPTVPVVVASSDIGVGEALGSHNLGTADWPASNVPDGAATSPAALAGRRALTPVGAGEIVTDARTRPEQLLAGLTTGLVAAFVPVGETALLTVLVPGTTVDLLSPTDGSVLAAGVRVLARPTAGGGASPALDVTGGLLVAVSREQATRLAIARGSGLPGDAASVVIHPDPPAAPQP